MTIFTVENIAIEILGHRFSYIELTAARFGLIPFCFFLQADVLSRTTGITNYVFFF